MSYIYHLKPEPFHGNKLIPLNQMDQSSALYKNHAQKYTGREEIMDERIPLLNCKWNDVVQFSALDPQIIVKELKKLQPELKLLRPFYFKAHINDIFKQANAVLYNKKERFSKDFAIQKDEIFPLGPNNYIEAKSLPEWTRDYWKKAIAEKRKVLWFPFVPHVLVKGALDVSSFEICQLKI